MFYLCAPHFLSASDMKAGTEACHYYAGRYLGQKRANRSMGGMSTSESLATKPKISFKGLVIGIQATQETGT